MSKIDEYRKRKKEIMDQSPRSHYCYKCKDWVAHDHVLLADQSYTMNWYNVAIGCKEDSIFNDRCFNCYSRKLVIATVLVRLLETLGVVGI